MATPAKSKKFQEYFNEMLKHINWDLIKPALEEVKLLSHEQLMFAGCKNEKQQLKYLLKQVNDPHKRSLFMQALKTTSHDDGHQQLLEILQDADNTGDDKAIQKVLENLLSAFEQFGKEMVCISKLSEKYIELYGSDSHSTLHKFSPNKRLKGFIQTYASHFIVDENGCVSLATTPSHNDKVGSKMVVDGGNKSFIIHFTYAKQFHKEILCNSVESLKEQVSLILSSKIPNHKPTEVKYQCGSEWYLLEEAETLEELLVFSKTEIYIKAIPQQCTHTAQPNVQGKPIDQDAGAAVNGRHDKKAGNVYVSGVTDQNLETSEDIEKKGRLKDVINVSIDHLQRSLAIMIKSVISRLYGTRETLKELTLRTQALEMEQAKLGSLAHKGNKKVDKMKSEISKIIDTKCNLWYSLQSSDSEPESQDWLYHFKKALPRKNKRYFDKEVEEISETTFNVLPADTLLKFIERAAHNGKLFSSMLINVKTQSFEYIDFSKAAKSVLNIRNFYAHPHAYEQIVRRFSNDITEITEMSLKIVSWVEREDGIEKNVAIVKDDLQHIKQKHVGHKIETSIKNTDVVKALLNLNFNQYGYVLFSVLNAADVAVPCSHLQQLSLVPWSAVVDFDTHSKENGLFGAMCEFDDINKCIKTKYLSPKKYISPFSYADLNRVKHADLVKSGHVPWLFPHGDVQDTSHEACPLNDRMKCLDEVRKPTIDAVRAIASSITREKSGAIVNLILCYGSFAYDSKKLPYPQFLDDFVFFCDFLSTYFTNVVLTDNVEICLLFKNKPEIKVFNFPLAAFCEIISDLFTAKDMPPIKLPTPHGLQEIQFVEEDFVLVHKHIAEHQMRSLIFQKQTEFRQEALDSVLQEGTTDEQDIRHEINKELRIKFYKCETVSFISLENNDAIDREEEEEIIEHLTDLLEQRKSKKTEPAKYVLYHTTGSGATTLSRKIVWRLKSRFPCVILKSNYKHSDRKIQDTSQTLKKLHNKVNLPILMLIDEEPSFQTVPQLTNRVQIDGIPMVFLHVQRFEKEKHTIKLRKNSDHFFLPMSLTKKDAYNFQEKLCIAFDKTKVSAGFKKIDEMTSSMILPKVGDVVQSSIDQARSQQYGTIINTKYQSSSYEVEVKWDKRKTQSQWCVIGKTDHNYTRVYITDISRRTIQLFKTFHLYGVMCLGEDFRKPMKSHVKNCLQTIDSKKELRVLAHLSILFAFQVVEVLPSRSFQRLCCRVMEKPETRDFDLNKFISDPAKEFAVIDALGRFCIVHSIVAEEILEYFLSSSETKLSKLVCEFLQHMIYDSEYRNSDIESIIRRLLYDRQMELSQEHIMVRKPFSNLILAIESEEGKEAAINVFQSALPLMNNHHAYSHLARYLSKRVCDFEGALSIADNAELLTDQDSEVAFVQNVKGDIYREELKFYLSNKGTNPNWQSEDEYAYRCHKHACEAYQKSYKANPFHYPLNGELKVRLLLLKSIKNVTREFDNALNYPIVAESVVKCYQLLQKLKEFIKHGDGGKDSDYDSRETSVTRLEAEFHDITERDSEDVKQILHNFICSSVKPEYKVHSRRWYVQIHTKAPHASPTYDYLLNLLDSNMETVGHNDIDMKLWLSIVRKLPTGRDMGKIKEKLLEWKSNISSTGGSRMWVNYYLTIFYFVKLISCNKTEVSLVISNFNDASRKVQNESKEDKSRSRIKNWLQAAGEGFQRLRSDEQGINEMYQLEGKVITLSTQETHRLISWKGIHVFLDSKIIKTFKDGQHVRFTVGFSLRGVCAINVEAVSSPASCSPISNF